MAARHRTTWLQTLATFIALFIEALTTAGAPMIQFSNVAVCYEPDKRYPINALDGVNLFIGPGEWVFFVGPSGAGKSTLLKLVYAGAHAARGRVMVDGQDVTDVAHREIPFLRRKIGVVFQDFQLLTQKTVWENVAFALQVIGAPQSKLVRDVPRALDTVGLTHKAGARPHELSGGEQQRVAIARAIVNDPKILVADEPTGNLDPQTASDIATVLRKINERGTTILMATHDRTLVDSMRQRVVRIADGHVISDERQGVYHPEDDEPRRATPAETTALDGSLAEITHTEAALHEQTVPAANPKNANSGATNSLAPTPVALMECLPPDASATPDASAPTKKEPVTPVASISQAVPVSRATPMPQVAPMSQVASVAQTAPNGKGSSGNRPSGNVHAANGAVQHDLPAHVDSVAIARDHKAPIGSPENPIVQYERASEIKMPHELEL
jgi:cell division transport system ATP-binding protein